MIGLGLVRELAKVRTWVPDTVGVYVNVWLADPTGRVKTDWENVPARLLETVTVVEEIIPLEAIVNKPLATLIGPDKGDGGMTV